MAIMVIPTAAPIRRSHRSWRSTLKGIYHVPTRAVPRGHPARAPADLADPGPTACRAAGERRASRGCKPRGRSVRAGSNEVPRPRAAERDALQVFAGFQVWMLQPHGYGAWIRLRHGNLPHGSPVGAPHGTGSRHGLGRHGSRRPGDRCALGQDPACGRVHLWLQCPGGLCLSGRGLRCSLVAGLGRPHVRLLAGVDAVVRRVGNRCCASRSHPISMIIAAPASPSGPADRPPTPTWTRYSAPGCGR